MASIIQSLTNVSPISNCAILYTERLKRMSLLIMNAEILLKLNLLHELYSIIEKRFNKLSIDVTSTFCM